MRNIHVHVKACCHQTRDNFTLSQWENDILNIELIIHSSITCKFIKLTCNRVLSELLILLSHQNVMTISQRTLIAKVL